MSDQPVRELYEQWFWSFEKILGRIWPLSCWRVNAYWANRIIAQKVAWMGQANWRALTCKMFSVVLARNSAQIAGCIITLHAPECVAWFSRFNFFLFTIRTSSLNTLTFKISKTIGIRFRNCLKAFLVVHNIDTSIAFGRANFSSFSAWLRVTTEFTSTTFATRTWTTGTPTPMKPRAAATSRAIW